MSSGVEEVNASGMPKQGGPAGSFVAMTLNRRLGEICFAITVQDITLLALPAYSRHAPPPPDASGHSSGGASLIAHG